MELGKYCKKCKSEIQYGTMTMQDDKLLKKCKCFDGWVDTGKKVKRDHGEPSFHYWKK